MRDIRPAHIGAAIQMQSRKSTQSVYKFVSFDFLLGLEQVVYDEGQFHLSRLLLVIRGGQTLVRRDSGDDLR